MDPALFEFRTAQILFWKSERFRSWGLVGFAEIATFLAEQNSGIPADDESVENAFSLLRADFERGVFHERGLPMVLFVNEGIGATRLTPDWLLWSVRKLQRGIRARIINFMLGSSWCTTSAALRFFKSHNIPPPARFDEHFSNSKRLKAMHARRTKKPGRGRRGHLVRLVVNAMYSDLQTGKRTVAILTDIKQLALPDFYPAKRTTCATAWKLVLKYYPNRPPEFPTNDK